MVGLIGVGVLTSDTSSVGAAGVTVGRGFASCSSAGEVGMEGVLTWQLAVKADAVKQRNEIRKVLFTFFPMRAFVNYEYILLCIQKNLLKSSKRKC